jgi:hypothetical protein
MDVQKISIQLRVCCLWWKNTNGSDRRQKFAKSTEVSKAEEQLADNERFSDTS